ncbi:zinc-dependent alcohol dehydrogenase [Streptomyces sp. bgisy100]|uniref:zinc-dependent alcohol dehydrogenase n=1 Tax=Streptomyces sp. bgisy100 TaxID=3413783 RepID=UPI003D73D1CB
MHQATYTGGRTVRVQPVRPPALPPGHVRIEVAYTGICGTDLHVFHGAMDARVRPPAVLGHEMSGRVAELGADVDGWRPGDPVTVMPLGSCGDCPACRAGHHHVCHRMNFIGVDSDGSMQTSWSVPAELLVALPDGLRLDHAALLEPTAVAVHDVNRAGVRAGEKALVVGGGPVGLLIATVARRAGAEVRVSEPDAHRRAVAEELGLATIDPVHTDVATVVTEWTGGAGVPIAFEVSGAAPGVAAAVDCMAVRGRLVMVAIHPTPRAIDLHRFFWRELTLIGARLYRRTDFEAAVRLLGAGHIPAEALISRIEPLHRVQEAFSAVDSGDGVMKVLIDCQDVAEAGRS